MATLSVGNVHVNAPLSNLARRYRPLDDGFVADDICPRLPVQFESNSYYIWQQDDFFSVDVSDLVADRAPPREVDVTATTDTYQCVRRELAFTVSDRERNNADSQLQLESVKQRNTLSRLALLREMRVAATLQPSSVTTTINGEIITGGLDSNMTAAASPALDSATTTWRDFSQQLAAAKQAMRLKIGVSPNTIVIPQVVAEGMMKSLIWSSSGGPLQTYTGGTDGNQFFQQQLPYLPPTIGGMRVLSPGNIKNTAKEGQTASYADIWGKNVLLLYVTPSPAMEIPSVAYTFQAEPLQTRTSRKDIERLDWFGVGNTIVEKVVAPFAGYRISAAVS